MAISEVEAAGKWEVINGQALQATFVCALLVWPCVCYVEHLLPVGSGFCTQVVLRDGQNVTGGHLRSKP